MLAILTILECTDNSEVTAVTVGRLIKLKSDCACVAEDPLHLSGRCRLLLFHPFHRDVRHFLCGDSSFLPP